MIDLNESKGTPDIIKDIINENSTTINKIIENSIDDVFSLNINKNINLDEKTLSLKCDLNIHFHFNKDYNGNIKFDKASRFVKSAPDNFLFIILILKQKYII